MTRRELTPTEENAALFYLHRKRGMRLDGHPYRVGDVVLWDGGEWIVYDHEAEGNTSTLVLLNRDKAEIATGVDAAQVTKESRKP